MHSFHLLMCSIPCEETCPLYNEFCTNRGRKISNFDRLWTNVKLRPKSLYKKGKNILLQTWHVKGFTLHHSSTKGDV